MDIIKMLGGKEKIIKICKNCSNKLTKEDLDFIIESLKENREEKREKNTEPINLKNLNVFQKRKILPILAEIYNSCFDKLMQKKGDKK